MQRQVFYALSFLFTCVILAVNADNEQCSDKWICNHDDKCVRFYKETQKLTTYTSKNACRLICGRYGALWPRPTSYTVIGPTLLTFSPSDLKFDFTQIPQAATKYVESVLSIFHTKISRECGGNCGESNSEKDMSVRMIIQSDEMDLTWDTDESYHLYIVTDGEKVTITITSLTVYGFRHGLETLSQMMTANTCESGLFLVKSASIEDRPVYRHRGLLLDTARNFLSIADIKRTIEGMAASKFNVFHWHITDSQSFPLEIPSLPQFVAYGAYSGDQVYTPSDVRKIIDFAKLRGIRTIIEIDIPSHSGNGWDWGPKYGLGNLAVCVNKQPWRKYCIQPPCGQLNPVNSLVFGVLRDIYRHIASMVPRSETIHVGGDEVHFGCWNATKEIVDYMLDHGLGRDSKDFLQLWAEFHQAALSIWDEETGQDSNSRRDPHDKPKKVIIYSSHLTDAEHIEKYLQKDRYVIQTWVESNDEMPQELLQRGYQLIMSTKNAWYFDHGFWGITRFYTWKNAYDNRLPLHRGVLGGEACVWSELIDGNNLDSRVWPRASAVGERLWSNPETPSTMASERLYRQNERLQLLKIKPEPISPKYCILNEGQCT